MRDAAPDAPELSVIVPAYGGAELLERCLAAVERELAATGPWLRAEIVVVDDATPGGLPGSGWFRRNAGSPGLARYRPRRRAWAKRAAMTS